jgi:prepilin-type N-terminal cleavage/methylation domain-containing protein
MCPASRRAFTLIEVLTVIGIIAVLVAILFPVFSRAREQARQTACMSNMQEVYVKVSLYLQDYDAYPPLLLGLPENPDGSLWQAGGAPPVAAGSLKQGYLFPAYVRDISKFHCPNNFVNDPARVVNASFPNNAGFAGNATYGSHGIAWPSPGQPIPYYAYDSYDVSAAVGQIGAYSVVYSRDWTNAEGRGIDARADNPNQLKYPNPPLDQTVLAWCTYHVQSGSDKCPVVMASGTARAVAWSEVSAKSWNFAGR